MTTLLELLAASRLFAFRTAVVDTLATVFPECEVKAHPGKLDIGDVDAKDIFRAPALAVAITRQPAADGRMSGTRDTPVDVTVYVVVEDLALGDPPRLVTRDELGLALCDGMLAFLAMPAARWGLADIDFPSEAVAQPVFTALSFERGTAYYAVTWRQTLYGLGEPIWDMDSPTPPAFAPKTILPGDPDYPAEDAP